MTHTEATNILRTFICRIERFEVDALDAESKQRIEQFLNGYDLRKQCQEVEGSGAVDVLAELPSDSSEEDLLEVIEPQITLWATSYLPTTLYEKLRTVSVHFAPRALRRFR